MYAVDATLLIALALSVTAFLRLAYRRRGSIWGEILDRAFIFFLIICLLLNNGRHPLSLNFIEIIGLAAPLTLSIGKWPLRSILYYGTLLLILQMLLVPRFDLQPFQWGFWQHWVALTAIITAAVYDLLVNRYHPRWRDWAFASLAILIYDTILTPIDLPLKVNHRLLILSLFAIATSPLLLPRRERRPRPITPVLDLDEDTELVYST